MVLLNLAFILGSVVASKTEIVKQQPSLGANSCLKTWNGDTAPVCWTSGSDNAKSNTKALDASIKQVVGSDLARVSSGQLAQLFGQVHFRVWYIWAQWVSILLASKCQLRIGCLVACTKRKHRNIFKQNLHVTNTTCSLYCALPLAQSALQLFFF